MTYACRPRAAPDRQGCSSLPMASDQHCSTRLPGRATRANAMHAMWPVEQHNQQAQLPAAWRSQQSSRPEEKEHRGKFRTARARSSSIPAAAHGTACPCRAICRALLRSPL